MRRIIRSKLSKLTDKQTDKVGPIIRQKLEPFRFHIKTDYLSDANYSTDNPSEMDDPVSSVRAAIGLDGCSVLITTVTIMYCAITNFSVTTTCIDD